MNLDNTPKTDPTRTGTYSSSDRAQTLLRTAKRYSVMWSGQRFRYNAADMQYIRPLSDAEVQDFLLVRSDEDDDRVTQLWDRYSGLPGLLDADVVEDVTQNAAKKARYIYDLASGRYRSLVTGRFVPESSIRAGVIRVSDAVRRDLRDVAGELLAGNMTPEKWYREMLKALKDEYRAQWLSAIGGKKNYNRRQAYLFGRATAPQFRWLNNFLAELQSGKQPMNGRVAQRAGMYARAGNVIYQAGRMQEAIRTGNRFGRRILGETDQHCHDTGARPGCVELSKKGWLPIEQIVPIGEASCYSNCLCQIEYKKARPATKAKKPQGKKKSKGLPHSMTNVPPLLRLTSNQKKRG